MFLNTNTKEGSRNVKIQNVRENKKFLYNHLILLLSIIVKVGSKLRSVRSLSSRNKV